MQDRPQKPETPELSLQDIAAEMSVKSSNRPGKPPRSTYAEVLMQLNHTFYKVSETVPKDDPQFVTMVLLDVKAARLRTKIKEGLDANKLTEVKSGAEETIHKMQTSKAAVAFHDRYLQDYTPMKTEANQISLKKEELETRVTTYVAELHSKLAVIDKDWATGKSDKKINTELDGLYQQWKTLQKQAESLEVDMNHLLTKLTHIHQEAYLLLPSQDRPGTKPTAPAATTGISPRETR